jgi:hypothetical protein
MASPFSPREYLDSRRGARLRLVCAAEPRLPFAGWLEPIL